jgi:hypothetical protein
MSNECKSRKYFCDVRVRKYNRVETAESGTELRRTKKYFGIEVKSQEIFILTECERQEIFLDRETMCQGIFIRREGKGRKYSGNRGVRTREYLNGQREDAGNILEMNALSHGLFIWT